MGGGGERLGRRPRLPHACYPIIRAPPPVWQPLQRGHRLLTSPACDCSSVFRRTMKLLISSLAVCNAYQAALAPRTQASAVSMTAIQPGDVGTTRPLGVWDPLGLMTKMPEKYRRWQEMEIKHGRIAMLASLHVIVTGAGYKWSGYCSYLSFPPLKFDDIPAGTLGKQQPAPNSLAAAA